MLDLLYDEDQDVRVVAAISLAHAASEIKSIKTRSEVVNGWVVNANFYQIGDNFPLPNFSTRLLKNIKN